LTATSTSLVYGFTYSGTGEQENKQLFGHCNNQHGHGHNYVLEVTVCGKTDPVTGMVVNIADLKVWIQQYVLSELDHRNLDLEVEAFREGLVSTAENIAVWVWDRLYSVIPPPARLYQVKLWETEKNIITYRGERED